jgi:hypothetical protein
MGRGISEGFGEIQSIESTCDIGIATLTFWISRIEPGLSIRKGELHVFDHSFMLASKEGSMLRSSSRSTSPLKGGDMLA